MNMTGTVECSEMLEGFPEVAELEILGVDNFNVVGSGVGPKMLSMVMASIGSEWVQMNVHHPDLEKVHGWVWIRPIAMSKLAVGWVQLRCEMLHRNLIENLPMWAEVSIRYDVEHQFGKVTLPYVI